ncbi:MAG: Asp-tRNA(Asn)/Glu-tRNA(Gln) amidotransferase subunit GatC [Patescibacteria group bacterium]|nr:Asp-tRNA(Asn)/Glu-tRNA(Gln) amidotransferase subunit GatC [Patescibacteria group bacterium]
MALIDQKTIKYLAGLARIEIKPEEETKLKKDLEEILRYFEQLEEVDTEGIKPMTGGTLQKNIFRNDKLSVKQKSNPEELIKAFPDKEGRFLKIPPVFE